MRGGGAGPPPVNTVQPHTWLCLSPELRGADTLQATKASPAAAEGRALKTRSLLLVASSPQVPFIWVPSHHEARTDCDGKHPPKPGPHSHLQPTPPEAP